LLRDAVELEFRKLMNSLSNLALVLRNAIFRPVLGRAFTFLIGNVAAQAASALTGLLLARWLSVPDYAIYTLIGILMGAIAVLTKSGVHLGFTAILGRHWPDMERAAAVVEAAWEARKLISIFVLPPLLAVSAFLLIQNHVAPILTGFFMLALIVFWWADMRTRIIDQILFFAGQTSRLQIMDTLIGMARLIAVVVLYVVNALSPVTAVLVGVLVAIVRIGPVVRWIRRLLPDIRISSLPADTREIRSVAMRQMPVELFYVFQSQIVILLLSSFGSTANVAGFGAIGRISQLLVPVSALSYAFCVPIFARATTMVVPILVTLVALSSIPGIMLILASFVSPSALLWLIGPNYSGLHEELVVCSLVGAINSIAGIAWNLAAHRGWNRWAWLQIPIGLVWCIVAPKILDVGSISGALLLGGGFSIGLIVSTVADVINGRRRGVL
jgi:O-antigen/teichoic acid export membrane protein